MRSFGMSTYDEYSDWIEEERKRKEMEYPNLQQEGNKLGADLIAFNLRESTEVGSPYNFSKIDGRVTGGSIEHGTLGHYGM